jgi:septal ring factor EnvC (AmiA/AmiB activator)
VATAAEGVMRLRKPKPSEEPDATPSKVAAPLAGQLAFAEATTAGSPWRKRLLIAGIVLAFLLLAAAGAGAGYLAFTNDERADRWQARAAALDQNVEALNDVVLERTEDLNERTEELNAMAGKVQRAETAITRSEADVRALERRQRRLANEKAQVEDARARLAVEQEALADVASSFVSCKDGLVELLNYFATDDFSGANAAYNRVASDCENAEQTLASYSATYGE